jgi:predicted ferric reductase
MTSTLLAICSEVRPSFEHPATTVGATLGEIHRWWMNETSQRLGPAWSPTANFWTGWNVVRYIGDQFDWRYRRHRALVAAIVPLLGAADAFALCARTKALHETRDELDRLGRRQGYTATVAVVSHRFLEHVGAWFAKIQRVTREISADQLSLQDRQAPARLRHWFPAKESIGQ